MGKRKPKKYVEELWKSIFDQLKKDLGRTPTMFEVQNEYNRKYGDSARNQQYD